LVQGQLPHVDVFARDRGGGKYADTKKFSVLRSDGSNVEGRCDRARAPKHSRGVAALNFACKPMSEAGTYTVRVEPPKLGMTGAALDLPIRILKVAPQPPAAPAGWRSIPLVVPMPKDECYRPDKWYGVELDGNAPVFRERSGPLTAKIPVGLEHRLSSAHADGVRYVFEENDGWIVLFDHGEFGGGVEWYPRRGGEPRSIVIGNERDGRSSPQNVNRALALGGSLYLLQGLSHIGISTGQLAKVWREHDHFTSHVIAVYESEPFDWVVEADGTWLVATHEALWRTREAGARTLVARFPGVLTDPDSMVRTADGTLYVGGRNGVLRLTPAWPEMPRYLPDWLVTRADDRSCRRDE
jgi:hypothetical protein